MMSLDYYLQKNMRAGPSSVSGNRYVKRGEKV